MVRNNVLHAFPLQRSERRRLLTRKVNSVEKATKLLKWEQGNAAIGVVNVGGEFMTNSITEIICSRRTIGAFRPDAPPRDTLLAALEAARWAPNHKKTEPWNVIHLGPKTIQKTVDLNSRIVAAIKGTEEGEKKRKKWSTIPGWFVVTSDLSEDSIRREEDFAACCCFVQNLTLVLWSLGVGTKWTTGDVTRHVEFYDLLSIDPNQQRVVGLFWYGYPEVIPEQTRRPVADFFHERA